MQRSARPRRAASFAAFRRTGGDAATGTAAGAAAAADASATPGRRRSESSAAARGKPGKLAWQSPQGKEINWYIVEALAYYWLHKKKCPMAAEVFYRHEAKFTEFGIVEQTPNVIFNHVRNIKSNRKTKCEGEDCMTPEVLDKLYRTSQRDSDARKRSWWAPIAHVDPVASVLRAHSNLLEDD